MNALVINHYAANKGDRAILYFVIRELLRNEVSSITVSAHDRSFWPNGMTVSGQIVDFVPWGQFADSQSDDGQIKSLALRAANKFRRKYAFPLIKKLLRRGKRHSWTRCFSTAGFARALDKSDLVIGTGGHHIQTRFTAESLSALTYDMALAVLSGKPVVLWSQSIGPLDFSARENEFFVRDLVNSVRNVYIRDDNSLAELRKIGACLGHVRKTYDSVIGLNDEIPKCVPMRDRDAVVGVSVYSAEARTPDAFERYVASLAGCVDFVAKSGCRIRFFPMEMKGAVADDRPCIKEVLTRVQRKDACEVVEPDLDTVTHLKEVAKCRVFLGHKTHSQVFALTVGTPLIALAYHEKTADFMAQYGLRQNCVLDSELTTGRLAQVFRAINQDLERTASQQFTISHELGQQVRKAFSGILAFGK